MALGDESAVAARRDDVGIIGLRVVLAEFPGGDPSDGRTRHRATQPQFERVPKSSWNAGRIDLPRPVDHEHARAVLFSCEIDLQHGYLLDQRFSSLQ